MSRVPEKNNADPIVSVIMPAYNAEKYIQEAIESIKNQTLQQWELIIVEDCSTDQTLTVIKSCLQDTRIKLFQNNQNLGIAASRNRAISLASGKYIAIQDDDDLSFPDRLEKQVRFLDEHKNVVAVAGHWLIIDEKGEQVIDCIRAFKNPKYVKAHLLFSDCIGNGSAMFRRDCALDHNLHYRDSMLGMEDFFFWIEFSKIGDISAVDSIVYKHRRHASQETEKHFQTDEQDRQALYAWMQRESLRMSGITLSHAAAGALERLGGEKSDPDAVAADYVALYEAFREVVDKAEALNLANTEEIAIACRKLLGRRIANSKGFWKQIQGET